MTAIRLAAVGLALTLGPLTLGSLTLGPLTLGRLTLGLDTARAAEPERTGSLAPAAPVSGGTTASVTLPMQSVTAPPPPIRALPPLKPLPKWDPHVCIGC